jgi:hypothetical protein
VGTYATLSICSTHVSLAYLIRPRRKIRSFPDVHNLLRTWHCTAHLAHAVYTSWRPQFYRFASLPHAGANGGATTSSVSINLKMVSVSSYYSFDRTSQGSDFESTSTGDGKGLNASPYVGLMPVNTASSLPVTEIPRRRWHWSSVLFILGFQLVGVYAPMTDKSIVADSTAFLSAIGHYLLFEHLNGSEVDSGRLTQSHISAVSLLFVTVFKSALTASIGSCFAQHLWLILRCDATSVSVIERLFTLRTNVLALCDPRTIWRAPILFLMAAYVWCLGIATIYPPGAITVGLQPRISTQLTEVLTINPFGPSAFDRETYVRKEPFDTLAGLTWRVNETRGGAYRETIYFDYGYVCTALYCFKTGLTLLGVRDRPWPTLLSRL